MQHVKVVANPKTDTIYAVMGVNNDGQLVAFTIHTNGDDPKYGEVMNPHMQHLYAVCIPDHINGAVYLELEEKKDESEGSKATADDSAS